MYDRFTDRSRKVMQLANQEAKRLNHEYIGSEHILLGLVTEGSGVAANILKNFDLDLSNVGLEVEKILAAHPASAPGRRPHPPRAKQVVEYSMEEALKLKHNYVGTEHLLLGLLREQDGIASGVLVNLGVTMDRVQAEILEIMGRGLDPAAHESTIKVSRPESSQRWRVAAKLVLIVVFSVMAVIALFRLLGF